MTKEKLIKIDTPIGVYTLTLNNVAEQIAYKYYDKEKELKKWTSQVNKVLKDDFMGIDWVRNNIDFGDLDKDSIEMKITMGYF